MEVFPSTMKPAVHCREEDGPSGRKYEEHQSRSLCLGMPFMFSLKVLEGVRREKQLCDGQWEHNSEKYRNVPCKLLLGPGTSLLC